MIKDIKRFFYRLIFNETKRDSLITVMAMFLLLIGLLFSTSASMSTSTTVTSTAFSFIKQVVFIIVAVVAYYAISNLFTVPTCRKLIRAISFGEVILLLTAVVSCHLLGAINGNYSWIQLPGGMSIQPAEFAKVVTVLVVASLLADKRFKGMKLIDCIRDALEIFGAFVVIIVLLQKDTGSGIIVFFIGCICYLIPSNKIYHQSQKLLMVLAVLGVCFVIFCMTTEVGLKIMSAISTTFGARFRAVVNPSYNDDGTREIFYSLLGISKGSLFGVGLGNSVQKFGYLVSSEADYVFAVIVEETGILGIAMVFIPYLVMIARLLYYCKKVDTEAERVILVGNVAYLFLHLFLNVGGVSGLIPLTGVPLLFLSRGGSSLLSVMTMLGISQAVISEYTKAKEEKMRSPII